MRLSSFARGERTLRHITARRRTKATLFSNSISKSHRSTLSTSQASPANGSLSSAYTDPTNSLIDITTPAPTAARRTRRSSPTLAGSPIRRNRPNGSTSTNLDGPAQICALLNEVTIAQSINYPTEEHFISSTATVPNPQIISAPVSPPLWQHLFEDPLIAYTYPALNPQPVAAPINPHLVNAQAILDAQKATEDPVNDDWSDGAAKMLRDCHDGPLSAEYEQPTLASLFAPINRNVDMSNYRPRALYGRMRPNLEQQIQATGRHQQPVRFSSTQTSPPELSTEQYHELADEYIDSLISSLEVIQDDNEYLDIEYSAGVLTLTYPPHGVYVINKQPPNKQIWLSSPISGPFRFDYREVDTEDGRVAKWVDRRQGTSLSALLETEMKESLPVSGEGRVWDGETGRYADKSVEN